MAVLEGEPHLEPMVDPLERDLRVALVDWCLGYSGPHGAARHGCTGRGAPEGPQAMLADAQANDQRSELVLLAPLCLEEVPGPVDSRLALPGPTSAPCSAGPAI